MREILNNTTEKNKLLYLKNKPTWFK